MQVDERVRGSRFGSGGAAARWAFQNRRSVVH